MNLSRSHNAAFVITENDAAKLSGLASGFIGENGKLHFVVTCADATRTFDDLTSLKAYENGRRKKIERLRVVGRSEDYGREVELSFGGKWKPIEIDMKGPEPEVANHLSQIEEVIDGMKPWYSWFAVIDFVWVMVMLVCGVVILASIWRVTKQGLSTEAIIGRTSELSFIISFAALAIGASLNWIRACVFPKSVFALGQGVGRHKNGEFLRIVVLVGLAINILAGIILMPFSR